MDTLIITINDKRNYGNRLQNWALSRVLSRRGTCKTASTLLDGDLAKGRGTRARERAAYVRDLLRRGSAGHEAAVRHAAVERFDRRWGLNGPILTFRDGLSGRWRPDTIVIGSDQVWNAMWASPDDLSLRLGMNFDGPTVVSYAASVGTEDVPKWAVPAFREGIARMGAVSVREDRAADVLGGILGRPVAVVADPVALLTPEEWRSVFPGTVGGSEPFALEYFLGEPSAEQRSAMDAFESENGLAVRRAGAPGDPSAGAGPGSLAELACRASAVFTDSYHGCLLALLFGTPVKAFSRRGLPQGLDMSSRMRTLERALGSAERCRLPTARPPSCRGRPSSARCAGSGSDRSDGWMPPSRGSAMTGGRAVSPISRVGAACCGCAACAAVCPARCITMKEDKEGFERPVVDAGRCTGCGACSKACPALSGRRGDGVLSTSWAVSRDGRLLERSSSGGVFGQMARRVISRGGTVYGARWERACRSVSHARADDPSSLEPLLMSKYLQSTVRPETYALVGRDLAEGRTVLYCGTACQVAGLTGYLEARGVERGRLLAVDVICHGAPSPLLWRRWRTHVGRSRLSRIKAVDFRRKDPSWEGYSVAYGMSGGGEALVPHTEDWYLFAFLRNICLRPSCAACPAKGRCGSDVTLGDFWGIGGAHPEVDRSRGVSAVIARTERGMRAIEEISDALVSGPSEYASVLEGNPSLERPPAPHPDREAFMSALSSGAGAAELRRRWPLGLPPEPTVAGRIGRRLLGLLKGRNR